MCFPNTCTDSDLTKIFDYGLKKLDSDDLPFEKSLLNNSKVNCKEKLKIDSYLVAAIIVTGIIGVLIILATILEIYYKFYKVNRNTVENIELKETSENLINKDENIKTKVENNDKSLKLKILLCFSAYNNTLKIFQTDNKGKSQFLCLNSIRFWAFMWVTIFHQTNHYIYVDDIVLSNKFEYFDWNKNLFFTIITNGAFCVDVFFLIGGFLCAYNFLKQSKSKKTTWVTVLIFYVRRYYRITITLMLVMLFIVGFSPFVHPGPFRNDLYFQTLDRCHTFFWTNLLQINNFFSFQCFGHSWYLATDMQFYLIAPLVLVPLTFKNKMRFIGYGFIGIFILIHIITTFAFVYKQQFTILTLRELFRIYNALEFMPWCRVAPFAFKNFLVVVMAWILSLFFIAIVIFGEYGTISGLDPLNRTSQILYLTFCRIFFSIGLSGVIFLCITENGGFINQFLSWSFWAPLAKLSYCAYLVHYSVLDAFMYAQEQFVYMQFSLFFYVFLGNVFLIICLAYVTNLLFESPFMNLEKYIFTK
ncbi:unnamed protein product [Brachionus calyciflorus]|uniref:Acyltransferase 3 domain-containing protein n=1 Tax=Brachionus calyciflorus TaxID=104777 RepID=A0A813MAP4_9BILA|nr:unnamed protein product [Brachionus calyciflorus]